MIRQCELVERVRRYKPEVNEKLLTKAYLYAMQKHQNQKRASGDPYFSHPLEVAAILADMHVDEATIAVALLHDTIEDTVATREEIDEIFGVELGKLVEGLTKLTKLDLVSRKVQQAENFRKLLLAVSEDIRVLLVKLADRLHNMRTLDHIPENKRIGIAEETMEIYAPLAGRMGMQEMREELEDLAFRQINPEGSAIVTQRILEVAGRNKSIICDIEETFSNLFEEKGLKATVKGRIKKPFSVFRKMQQKTLSFEQLSDILGFRIITDTNDACYRILGCIHMSWSMVPGRFKDYISTPKQNDYRSLHTTIIGPSRKRIELQIRTEEMNNVAEYGIAAHAFYKDCNSKSDRVNQHKRIKETNAYAWLHKTIKQLSEGDNPEDFLENTKLELFQDQVFCFTPKGMLIALPRDATPIDFAYAVHTDIGNRCVGAKVNGCMMPLMVKLQNGDEIEIICSKNQLPRPGWEQIVITGKARAAIKKATRATIRTQYAALGATMLERAFARAGYSWRLDYTDFIIQRFGRKDSEDALIAVGKGELSSDDVVKALFPNSRKKKPSLRNLFRKKEQGWFNIRNAAGMLFKIPRRRKKITEQNSTPPMLIRGMQSDLPVRFAEEGAVPGDRIVGIFQPGSGITIYPIQSASLRDFDKKPECWLDVRWDIDEASKERFPARISVITANIPGSLAKVANIIANNDANIHSLVVTSSQPDCTEMIIDLEVWNLDNLNRVLSELKSIEGISQVKRVNG